MHTPARGFISLELILAIIIIVAIAGGGWAYTHDFASADRKGRIDIGGGYSKNSIYVYFTAPGYSQPTILSGADPVSFKAVPGQVTCIKSIYYVNNTYVYYEDATHVYAEGGVLTEADPATFKILGMVPQPGSCGDSYAADKSHVYFFNQLVTGADPATFQVLPHVQACGNQSCEAKDAKHYYWNAHAVDINPG